MSDSAAELVRNKLVEEWRRAITELSRLGTVSVRPSDPRAVIRVADGVSQDVIGVAVDPVVLSVPERASPSKRLYVHIMGWFEFSRACWDERKILETVRVSAEAAYFRSHKKRLTLVHGAHYDHTPSHLGHPVFHMQLRGSLFEYGGFIQQQFGIEGEISDGIRETLRNVRSPSAQVDIFSLLLQVGADQLLHQSSGREERRAFNRLRSMAELCGPLCRDGAPEQGVPSSRPDTSFRCYRARHWYPNTTDAVPDR
jgi:hypothetical protein